jgi:molybdate transport system substrate-binding protein
VISRTIPALLAAATLAAACSPGAGRTGTSITVLAASSLTEPFEEIAADLRADDPDLTIRLVFAGSSELVSQVVEGAPADVVATADLATMQRMVDADVVREPIVFATNALEIAVEPGNPTGVRDVRDLASGERLVVLCAASVPCGAYAASVLDRLGLVVRVASFEENVKAVVAKVALGEADVGIAYRSDVLAADGRVLGIPIADVDNVLAEYPLAVVADTPDPVAAQVFVDAVTSPAGRAVLSAHGFGSP